MLQISYFIPDHLHYFVGHFPDNPILPAVAFVDISHDLIIKNFYTSQVDINYQKIHLVKIKAPVTPNQDYIIQLEEVDEKLFVIRWLSQKNELLADLKIEY